MCYITPDICMICEIVYNYFVGLTNINDLKHTHDRSQPWVNAH